MMIVCSTEGVCEIDKKATFIILSYLKFCLLLNNKLWINIMKKCNKYEVWNYELWFTKRNAMLGFQKSHNIIHLKAYSSLWITKKMYILYFNL